MNTTSVQGLIERRVRELTLDVSKILTRFNHIFKDGNINGKAFDIITKNSMQIIQDTVQIHRTIEIRVKLNVYWATSKSNLIDWKRVCHTLSFIVDSSNTDLNPIDI